MKSIKTIRISIFALLSVVVAGCMETDHFDGLTDTRPKAAVTFPGRQYDQNAGLAFIITGFASNPDVIVPMKLEGPGSVSISKVIKVEARAALLPSPGGCSAYAVIQATETDITDAREYSYSVPLPTLTASAATCTPSRIGEGMYYEFIFTLELSDGSTVVTMPVRAQIKK